jgi:hypothetical protein
VRSPPEFVSLHATTDTPSCCIASPTPRAAAITPDK